MRKGSKRGATYKVEAVDVCLLDPVFEGIRHLRWRAYDERPVATEADVLGHGVLRPLRVRG